LIFTLFFCLGLQVRAQQIPQFVDITTSSGIDFVHINGDKESKKYLFEAKGGGIGFCDLDNDGWIDILLVQGSTMERFRKGTNPHCRLYQNLQNGTFEDITEKAGLSHSGWGMGVTFGDYDNDGWADIYLTNLQANALFRNNCDGTFTDMTSIAGVGTTNWSASAAFGDYDRDGDLDLYVANYVYLDFDHLPEPGSMPICNYRGRPGICGPMGLQGAPNVLYRNNGDGTFTDVTRESGVNENNRYFSLGVLWADLDGDYDLDLWVANDSTPNEVYINQGDGTFLEMGFLSGLAANADGGFQASMGIDVADYDNDGLMDAFATHFAHDHSTLYRNRGDLLFEDVTNKAQLIQPEWLLVSWGTRFVDLDHDGWKDLFHSNGHVYPFLLTAGWSDRYYQPCSFYLNQRDGTFRDVGRLAGTDIQLETSSRGMAFGDADNDGDIDLVITNMNQSPQLLRNDLENDNHWIMFRTAGRQSNRDGLGAQIRVTTGEMKQVWEIKRTVGVYSASDPRAHFGLGAATKVDLVEIQWPSGRKQEFADVAADRHYVIDEEEGLSLEFVDR
jgi:hypothetical protein